MWRQHRTPPSSCPYCGALLTAARDMEGDHTPTPGMFSICFYCTGLSLFAEDLTLKPFPPEDFSLLPHEVRQRIRQNIQALRDAKKELEAQRARRP